MSFAEQAKKISEETGAQYHQVLGELWKGWRQCVLSVSQENNIPFEEAAEIINRRPAAVGATVTPGRPAPRTTDFIGEVEKLVSQGLNRGAATRKIIDEMPELHKAWLSDLRAEAEAENEEPDAAERLKKRPPHGRSGRPADFMSEVEKVINEKHVGRGTAVSIVAKENPELHEVYLESLRAEAEEQGVTR